MNRRTSSLLRGITDGKNGPKRAGLMTGPRFTSGSGGVVAVVTALSMPKKRGRTSLTGLTKLPSVGEPYGSLTKGNLINKAKEDLKRSLGRESGRSLRGFHLEKLGVLIPGHLRSSGL